MNYRGHNIEAVEDGVCIREIKDFDPVHVFECGQCFRWIKQDDGSFTGAAMDRVVNVAYKNNDLYIYNTDIKEFTEIWFDYLDLGTDYSHIKKSVAVDSIMQQAIQFGYGIRLLRQDFWETLISFIISANNGIPRIMKIIESLSKAYGRKIPYKGHEFYSFPNAFDLSAPTIDELAVCRGGYRCKYISETSKMINNNYTGHDKLKSFDKIGARKKLMEFCGVGAKVADCTLLFSGIRFDVFPIDVWVKRVMEELYFHREATFSEIESFAEKKFGKLSGYAQQYLFYYARENRIGIKPKK